ncbi:MAG: hypothetical protein ACKODX_07825, partial [Gemmata sp.]
MSIPITCAGCKSAFDVPDTLAGKTIRCTSCKAQMTVPESLDAVDEVEVVEETGSGPKKAGVAPARKPSPPQPAAKKAAEVEVDEDEETDRKTKPGRGGPPAKRSGIVGSAGGAKRRRDDDDDDDDDDDRASKKKEKGGAGPMIAIIAVAAVLGLAGIGGAAWFFMKDKKTDLAAKPGDNAAKPGDNAPKPNTPNGAATGPGTTPVPGPNTGPGLTPVPGPNTGPGTTPVPGPNTGPGTTPVPGPNAGPGSSNPLAVLGKFENIGTSGEWAVHTGDGFTAEFPGQPEDKNESGPNNMPLKVTGVGAKSGSIALAGYMQFPPEVSNPQILLNLAVTGLGQVEPFKGKVWANTTVDGYAAKELNLKDTNGEGKLRLVAVKSRVYAFAAGGVMKDGAVTMPKADVDRFFASIKITYKGDQVAGGGMNPQPGPGPGPGPGPNQSGTTDGNLKIKIDTFYAGAFDAEKKEVFTVTDKVEGQLVKGYLARFSYPDFKRLGRFKLPQPASRVVIDSKAGLLYAATITNIKAAGLNLLDRSAASGNVAVYELKPIRDGQSTDGKKLEDGSELKPLGTVTVGQRIQGMELSADGKTLYVLVSGTGTTPAARKSSIVVIDTETRKELAPQRKTLAEPCWDMVKTADSKKLLLLELPGKNGSASVVEMDLPTLAVISTTAFPGAVLDSASRNGGGTMMSVMAAAPAGGAGGVGGSNGGPMGGGAPQQAKFKVFLLDTKGSTEMDLGVTPGAANNGYLKFDPDGKRLYVSSYRAPGFDVYDVTDATAASGLKLKSSIKTAGSGREGVGGHFLLSPDGKIVLFHNGVVLETENIGGTVPPAGGGGVPPGPGGGGVPPGPGGGGVPPGPGGG